jgi:hypothetical protein
MPWIEGDFPPMMINIWWLIPVSMLAVCFGVFIAVVCFIVSGKDQRTGR